MKYLSFVFFFVLLVACSKAPMNLDGTYDGNFLINKEITIINIQTSPDTVLNNSLLDMELTELKIKGNKFSLQDMSGNVSYDDQNIIFTLEKHDCPPEADCLFPLIHGENLYQFDGQQLSFKARRDYDEAFTSVKLFGFIEYDYNLKRRQ